MEGVAERDAESTLPERRGIPQATAAADAESSKEQVVVKVSTRVCSVDFCGRRLIERVAD